ncbi:MAG: hypothetical protein LUD72_07255 [Bacteroidales bacterium]|nr:hypothetical protein [Bacteroidales bacterium]
MKGGLVVFTSGNDGWAYGWPAQYDAVVAVGAIDPGFTAALIVSYFGGQEFTVDDLKERLFGGANYDAIANSQIGPLVDALGSFTYGADTASEPVSSYNVSASSNTLAFTWNVNGNRPKYENLQTCYKLLKFKT